MGEGDQRGGRTEHDGDERRRDGRGAQRPEPSGGEQGSGSAAQRSAEAPELRPPEAAVAVADALPELGLGAAAE